MSNKPKLPRAGSSNYKANAITDDGETLICFDDHFEQLYDRIVTYLAELEPKDYQKVQAVYVYRWNGEPDAGLWALSAKKPVNTFKALVDARRNSS